VGAGFGGDAPLPGWLVVPLGRLADAGGSLIPIGVGALTVTVACPLILPCVAVTCAVPALCPVAVPAASQAVSRSDDQPHERMETPQRVIASARRDSERAD
jgi:hypothetical protein